MILKWSFQKTNIEVLNQPEFNKKVSSKSREYAIKKHIFEIFIGASQISKLFAKKHGFDSLEKKW